MHQAILLFACIEIDWPSKMIKFSKKLRHGFGRCEAGIGIGTEINAGRLSMGEAQNDRAFQIASISSQSNSRNAKGSHSRGKIREANWKAVYLPRKGRKKVIWVQGEAI